MKCQPSLAKKEYRPITEQAAASSRSQPSQFLALEMVRLDVASDHLGIFITALKVLRCSPRADFLSWLCVPVRMLLQASEVNTSQKGLTGHRVHYLTEEIQRRDGFQLVNQWARKRYLSG